MRSGGLANLAGRGSRKMLLLLLPRRVIMTVGVGDGWGRSSGSLG